MESFIIEFTMVSTSARDIRFISLISFCRLFQVGRAEDMTALCPYSLSRLTLSTTPTLMETNSKEHKVHGPTWQVPSKSEIFLDHNLRLAELGRRRRDCFPCLYNVLYITTGKKHHDVDIIIAQFKWSWESIFSLPPSQILLGVPKLMKEQ